MESASGSYPRSSHNSPYRRLLRAPVCDVPYTSEHAWRSVIKAAPNTDDVVNGINHLFKSPIGLKPVTHNNLSALTSHTEGSWSKKCTSWRFPHTIGCFSKFSRKFVVPPFCDCLRLNAVGCGTNVYQLAPKLKEVKQVYLPEMDVNRTPWDILRVDQVRCLKLVKGNTVFNMYEYPAKKT